MKIGILAPLWNLDPTYSIASVARSHAHVLREAGEEVVFVAYENFRDAEFLPPGTELRLIPRLYDSPAYASGTLPALIAALADVDRCITHDVMFLGAYRPLAMAVKLAAEQMPALRWLHWCHSSPLAPGGDPDFYEPVPNSLYVTVSPTFIEGFEAMYGAPGEVRAVQNWLDPTRINAFHPLAAEIYSAMRLWEASFVAVYPTRMSGAKQVDKAIRLLAALNRLDGPAKLIVCGSHINHEEAVSEAERLRKVAAVEGFGERNFMIVADFDSRWARQIGHDLHWGVPPQAVSNLLGLSDLFILPSQAEACSLVALEAAFARNLVVYNSDLPNALEFLGPEIGEHLHARGMGLPFGTDTVEGGDSEPGWYERQAHLVLDALSDEKSLKFFRHVRKFHSPSWIYEHQMRPLLHGPW